MKRLFIALRLPEEALPDIAAAQDSLKEAIPGARWVEPIGAHLTLKFLGPVPDESILDIIAALEESVRDQSAYAYSIRGIGGFPTPTRPRVVWAGIKDDGQTFELAGHVERAMERLGFKPEGRDFHPHITLARVKRPQRLKNPGALQQPGQNLSIDSLRASEVTLFESKLSPKGATYSVVSRAALKDAADIT
jgi:RNA 2',3'-cyclic 3'-phosphodiesterase